MSFFLYTAYTLLYLGLILWGLRIARKTRRAGTWGIVLIATGVFYDNLILVLGSQLGPGPLLYALSLPRFVGHQLILPWLVLSAWQQLAVAGLPAANRPAARWLALAWTLVILIIGIFNRILPLHLEPEVLDGVTRYVAVGLSGPPLVSILSLVTAGFTSLILWLRRGWPWQFWILLLVLVGEALPSEALRRVIGSGIEVLLVAVLLVTEIWLTRLSYQPSQEAHP